MSSTQTTERNRLELLQTDYRRTWREFTVAMDSLQSTTDGLSAEDESVQAARERADAAASEYRDARNALADWLLNTDAHAGEGQSLACCQAA